MIEHTVFAAEIAKFGKDVQARADDIYLASAIELHKSIRVGSPTTGSPGAPIKTGYLRNSIQIGKGEFLEYASDGKGPLDGKAVPLTTDLSGLKGLKVGDAVTIGTNTVYAEVQEHMHKTHAGHWAMSVAGWQRIVQKYINQLLT